MKLLREMIEEVSVITEATEGGQKNYIIEGVFLQGEIPNKNGRKYPKDILNAEVERYIKELVAERRAWGELCHTDSPSIDLNRTSHLIKELRLDGDDWIGKAVIADSDTGKNVKALIDVGGKLGVSSRGLGSLKMQEGVNVVQNDFKLVTAADIVADPSAPKAFVEAIMEDAVEWFCDPNGCWHKKISEIKQEIHNTPKAQLEEAYLNAWKKVLAEISGISL